MHNLTSKISKKNPGVTLPDIGVAMGGGKWGQMPKNCTQISLKCRLPSRNEETL